MGVDHAPAFGIVLSLEGFLVHEVFEVPRRFPRLSLFFFLPPTLVFACYYVALHFNAISTFYDLSASQ
jgi:hypothetical protein